MEKRIRVSYEIITHESAEQGDAAEHGWVDETGRDMTPDKYDIEEGITAVDNAVKFLKDEGVIEASSSHFHEGVWYRGSDDEDYSTGDIEVNSYHLVGFTTEEQEQIFNRVLGK